MQLQGLATVYFRSIERVPVILVYKYRIFFCIFNYPLRQNRKTVFPSKQSRSIIPPVKNEVFTPYRLNNIKWGIVSSAIVAFPPRI